MINNGYRLCSIGGPSGAKLDGTLYEIGGTSRFDVDFSNARFSGALALNGKSPTGAVFDFGNHGFVGTVNEGALARAGFDGTLAAFNYIEPSFYGSNGQEIGGVFQLSTGAPGSADNVQITGVALAKQQ